MKAKTKPNNKTDEYATFESALKKVLTVSHKEMQERIKKSASDRASRAKA
jgi:predicted metal-dependent peptidase